MVHLNGTAVRDVDVEMSALRVEHPSSSGIAAQLPDLRSHPPPPYSPTPGPSRLNPAERLPTSPAGSEGSSAAAFFRTYQSSSADGRSRWDVNSRPYLRRKLDMAMGQQRGMVKSKFKLKHPSL